MGNSLHSQMSIDGKHAEIQAKIKQQLGRTVQEAHPSYTRNRWAARFFRGVLSDFVSCFRQYIQNGVVCFLFRIAKINIRHTARASEARNTHSNGIENC